VMISSTPIGQPTYPLTPSQDTTTGELFAQVTYAKPWTQVEPVLDSSRYFVLRVEGEGGKRAYVGMGFQERGEAFDFQVSEANARTTARTTARATARVRGRRACLLVCPPVCLSTCVFSVVCLAPVGPALPTWRW
jgi:hypothetical protein